MRTTLGCLVSACVLAALACAGGCTPMADEEGRMITPTSVTPPSSSFAWQISPDEQSVPKGQAASFTITIRSKRNINSRVKLSAQGATGATVTFSPQTIPDTGTTSTMTVATGSNTSIRLLDMAVIAVEEGNAEEQVLFVKLRVTGTERDFALDISPLEFELTTREPRRVVTGSLAGVNGFNDDVTLSLTSVSTAIVPDLPRTFTARSGSTTNFSFVVSYRPELTTLTFQNPIPVTLTATGGNVTHREFLEISLSGTTVPGLRAPR